MIKNIFWSIFLFLLINWQTKTYASIQSKDTLTTIKLGFVLPDGVDKLSIPFELNNNLIIIKVLLNNAIPLKLILDTGIRTTVLTEKTFTDLLNLTYSRKITIPGVGGKKIIDAYVTNNVTLEISGLIGRGHALIVLEDDLLQLKNYLGTNVHGILGYELFSRFIVEINYSKKIVTFYNPSHYKIKKRFSAFDLDIIDTKPYIYSSFSLNDSSVFRGKFMVDTGASHSFLIDVNSNPAYYIPQPSIYSHLGRGLGGELFGHIARIDKISLPPFSFEEVITTFPDSSDYNTDTYKSSRNGTIGGGLLSRFTVVFDYIHEKIYLKKGKAYKKPFEYNLSGLIVRAKGLRLDIYEIVEVRGGSSAERAGVKVGDEIIIINGHYTKGIKLDKVLGLINLKANKSIRMMVIRNGEKTKLNFKLERQV
ncbi:MAG: aspartyl protease family protein [Cyclobacteriaceae bacterium]|nr:aspartyl protease family protein [Cyclobacteriaceae bacterium]